MTEVHARLIKVASDLKEETEKETTVPLIQKLQHLASEAQDLIAKLGGTLSQV